MAKKPDSKDKPKPKVSTDDPSSKEKTSVKSDGSPEGALTRFMKGLKEAVAGAATVDKVPEKKPEAKAKSPAPTPATPTTISAAGKEAPTANGATPPVVNTALNVAIEPIEDEEVVLTDAEGRRYCRATDCDQIGIVDGYCRFHYLLYWKKIQNRKRILADGKLERYIEELTARYSDKFVELLRKDLRTEKDFLAAIQELELDDSSSSGGDEDEAKTYIEEISGVGTTDAREDEGF
jgi:hypothetical protein